MTDQTRGRQVEFLSDDDKAEDMLQGALNAFQLLIAI